METFRFIETTNDDNCVNRRFSNSRSARNDSMAQRFILVMSGKGGVGKSTVASTLARALSASLPKVGLLDLDLTGPSIPTIFGICGRDIKSNQGRMTPCAVGNIEIVSIGLLLADPNDAVIWRGPRKHGMITTFFHIINWTADLIIVDMPPGTSDEHLSTFELLNEKQIPYSVIVVTSPSVLSVADVRKGINLCRTFNARIVAIIENFCGVMCPCCGKVAPLAEDTAVDAMSDDTELPVIARIPFLPVAAAAADEGRGGETLIHYFQAVLPLICG
jgi:ATP-binding protein involved in chromosome partitioning